MNEIFAFLNCVALYQITKSSGVTVVSGCSTIKAVVFCRSKTLAASPHHEFGSLCLLVHSAIRQERQTIKNNPVKNHRILLVV